VIKGTKLDFYSVASPSPFAHRQITWIGRRKNALIISPLLIKSLLGSTVWED
jgi:hypothetical protein